MELVAPSKIHIDEVTSAMLSDVQQLAHQINEIRPLASDVLKQVKDELFGERVFSSNAIEGNTLTIRETRLVLQSKSYLDMRRKREAQEVLNLGEAALRVEQLLDQETAWHDVSDFLDVHAVLLRGISDSIAGKVRNCQVMITGARHQPPDSDEASSLLDEIFERLRDDWDRQNGLVLATWVHWAISRVHPFVDGNGRMARLWQDLILLKSRLTVAVIRPQEREVYLDALSSADDGDFNPLAQLVCQRVLSTFQSYLNAQQASDQLQDWASDFVGEVSEREKEQKKLAYERWRLAVEQLRDAFERCAALINRGGADSLKVQIQPFDVIDQPTWETLLSGGGAKRTWFFKLLFQRNETVLWYFFFFGKHYWTEADKAIGQPGPFVNIMISLQRQGESFATRLDELDVSPVSLRELFVIEKRIIARSRNDLTGKIVYEHDKSAIEIAKRFYEDVVFKQLS